MVMLSKLKTLKGYGEKVNEYNHEKSQSWHLEEKQNTNCHKTSGRQLK